ncbi:MAG: AEC family transporter, partial [Candidatus Atribacteria bacterium]|nr:AEC family transporter [Candidatus Atribacteria bacterium]
RFVFYISFPCLVFQSLQSSPIERMYWIIPPVAFTLISLVFVGSYFLGIRNLKLSSESSASFAMGAAFGNTAFLGYPFIMALLGEKSLPPAIFFDQMGNFLAVYSIGVAFCLYSKTRRFSLSSLWEILKLPPFIAFFLALILNGIKLPPLMEQTIGRLASTTVPIIMVAIGLSLSIQHVSKNLKPLLIASLIKLAVLPVLFLLVTRLFHFSSTFREVMILQSATPTLMSSYALASLYDLDLPLSSSVIFVTTIISLASLPLWSFLFPYI